MKIREYRKRRVCLRLVAITACTPPLVGAGCMGDGDDVSGFDRLRSSGNGLAFAYSPAGTCFTELGFDQLGWTIPVQPNTAPSFPVYVGIGGCDPTGGNATHVGDVTFDYTDASSGSLRVWFVGTNQFEVDSDQIYANVKQTPSGNDGQPTLDPSKFTLVDEHPGGTAYAYHQLENVGGPLYVIYGATIALAGGTSTGSTGGGQGGGSTS
jgi:hypothetical protein